jgi:hypothetical protein
LNKKRLALTKSYLLAGESKNARQELLKLPESPIAVSIMAHFPGPIVKAILSVRKAITFSFF